ncbi:MAG: hypothetical protein JO023_12945 [Chloroflexi bacterium]|nr:hypothetical protein [Chloroflexota bacterium]
MEPIGAFIGTFTLPLVLDAFHIQGAQLLVAAVCVAGFGLTFLLPKT